MTNREYYFNKLKSTFDQIDVNCNDALLVNELIHFAEKFNSIIEYEHSAFYVAFYDVDGCYSRYYHVLGKITVDEALKRLDDLTANDYEILNGSIKEISKEEYDKFNYLIYLEAIMDRFKEIERRDYENVDHEIISISEKIDALKKELGLTSREHVVFD